MLPVSSLQTLNACARMDRPADSDDVCHSTVDNMADPQAHREAGESQRRGDLQREEEGGLEGDWDKGGWGGDFCG